MTNMVPVPDAAAPPGADEMADLRKDMAVLEVEQARPGQVPGDRSPARGEGKKKSRKRSRSR